MFYSSHINNLPGTHTSSQLTQDQVLQQQQERLDRKMQDPKFALKQNLLYGSYMQECLREDAGMRSTRALSETPAEFRSYHKGHRERN